MAADAMSSQKEYLKKYLSKGHKEKKKKREKPKAASSKFTIIDDDMELTAKGADGDYVDYGDEAPQVVGVVDERPKELILEEEYRQNKKWRAFGNDDDQSVPSLVVPDQVKTFTLETNVNFLGDEETHAENKQNFERGLETGATRQDREENGSDSDVSLPRNRHRHDSDSNQSLPRSAGASGPETANNYDSDQSLPRRGRGSDSDCSPPRKSKNQTPHMLLGKETQRALASTRRRRHSNSDSDSRISRTDSKRSRATKANAQDKMAPEDTGLNGLQSSKTLRREMKTARRQEEELLQKMADSGRNALTVFRDRKTGKKRNLKLEQLELKEAELKKAQKEEKYREWGRGLKQAEMQIRQKEEMSYEMTKPLARYKDDADLDVHLRQQMREGDPALKFLKKKPNADSNRPVRQGPPGPPNRFGILPGYRWDGVDRSNGFEKERITRASSRAAAMEEAYKWSIEDM